MRWGVSVPNFGAYAEPGTLVELAATAERSGWDGFFLWDHIVVGDAVPVADPWVVLGAVAHVTQDLLVGPMVTPLPRRRPWVLARQATTLDHLSGGRLILGVGLGSPPEEDFATFGEPTDPKVRAAMVDEGLTVLTGMWSGEVFALEGEHYQVAPTRFAPRPTADIPIWVAATWPYPAPLRRAVRFQGVFPWKRDMSEWTAGEVVELTGTLESLGGAGPEFDIAIAVSNRNAPAGDLARAGATWLMVLPGMGDSPEAFATSIAAGPG